MNFQQLIAQAAAERLTALSPESQWDAAALADMIELPPDPKMGDLAFPCFKLAKALRKAPQQIAAQVAQAVWPDCVQRAEAAGPYVNFFLNRAAFGRDVLWRIQQSNGRFGATEQGKGKTICIDYSSINIAKPFHIGHLSSTVLGNSLYRIYEYLGYDCVGINHLGDWGTQFGKLIVAYHRWGSKEDVENRSIRALLELYVKFHDEAEKDDALNDEARYWFKQIEEGNEEALSLFNWFKELTLKEVGRVYDMLDVKFDSYAGESFYNDKMDRVVNELTQKGILIEDQGAKIVDLAPYDMPPCLILRSDGATLYATRDIAAALYRKDTYDFDKCLYVVAYQQNLHFKQWFKIIELMGYDWADRLEHVAFGMVSMQDGTLSTRKGKVLFLEEVLHTAVEKTRAIMMEKSPDLPNMEQAAHQVGVGAVVWSALYNGRIKDIVFSYDKVLNFEGETGPYAQYTHARACSVLEKAQKAGYSLEDQGDLDLLVDDESFALLKALDAFPGEIQSAMAKNEPYLVSRAVIAICQAFNKFYYERHIMDQDAPLRQARLALVDAARSVIRTGLYLVGLHAPEKM